MESYICTVFICMITLNVLNILVFENNRIKKEKKVTIQYPIELCRF